jgi:hypothetical protein
LNHAALRRPLLEQDRALPVQPALKAAEQLGPLADADEGPEVRVEPARVSAAPLVA